VHTLIAAGLYAAMIGLPWFGGHSGPHAPKALSAGERAGIENKVKDHVDYPERFAGRPFSTIGTAYKVQGLTNPFAFQETRTFGAAVECSSFVGPVIYGEQTKVAGVLQSPVFRWDDGGKTFYMKDCALSH